MITKVLLGSIVALSTLYWLLTGMIGNAQPSFFHGGHFRGVRVERSFSSPLLQLDEFAPPTKNETLVFLTTLAAYETFMDRGFFHQYRAALSLGFDVVLWGKGFPHYNNELSLEKNFEVHFEQKNAKIFAIYEMGCECKLQTLSKKYITINKWHECWGDYCSRLAFRLNISIMLHAYPNDMIFQSYISKSYKYSHNQRIIEHSPNTALPQIFSQYPDNERDIDLLLIGASSSATYPLRYKIQTLMNDTHHWKDHNGKPLNVVVRKHPGYTEMGEQEYMQAIAKNAPVPTHDMCDSQIADYANQIKRASKNTFVLVICACYFAKLTKKVLVFSASSFFFVLIEITVISSSYLKYQVKKYAEAAMAGTLLLGNTPSGLESQWGSFVVNVDNMNDAQIVDTIKYWLNNDEERLKRARVGYAFVHKYLTSQHQVSRMVGAVHRYSQGERGLNFPFPHKVLCAGLNPSSPETNGFCECIREGKSICHMHNRPRRGRPAQMYFDGPKLYGGELSSKGQDACMMWSYENGLKGDC